MIDVEGLTKRYGSTTAVDDLSFSVRTGVVTGFLGPNGSGKSTTMRCMIGLDRMQAGRALFDGKKYAELKNPLHEVGALLDAGNAHSGRSARNHLRWMAVSNGLSPKRVDEVLEIVGLNEVAKKRAGQFSLGMKQRLGIASVLLGDPRVVILDEPANGLDPEGIRWIREMLKHLASQGRAVLVSSHLLSEMALIADELVVIGKGRLIEQCTVDQFISRHAKKWVVVRSPQLATLVEVARANGMQVATGDGVAEFHGVESATIGELAARNAIVLHELSTQTGSLEDAFLEVTASSVEYHGRTEANS
ncbi:MAG: ABC transporter ATP-binding protein [Ilumatobacteraceae bacterium]